MFAGQLCYLQRPDTTGSRPLPAFRQRALQIAGLALYCPHQILTTNVRNRWRQASLTLSSTQCSAAIPHTISWPIFRAANMSASLVPSKMEAYILFATPLSTTIASGETCKAAGNAAPGGNARHGPPWARNDL